MSIPRAIGIDHGDARIGIAGSDDLGMMAHPVATVDARAKDAVAQIARIVSERGAQILVVGLPRNMDGTCGPAAEKVRAFIAKLQAAMPDMEIREWDERLTTVAAERALRESGRNARNSRKMVDQVAAQMILQSWLDGQTADGGLSGSR